MTGRLLLMSLGLTAAVGLTACVSPDPSVHYLCSSDQDCPAGDLCSSGRCGPRGAVTGEDAGASDAGAQDAGVSDGGAGDGGAPDSGEGEPGGCPYRVLPFFDGFETNLDRTAYWREVSNGGSLTATGGELRVVPAAAGTADTFLESAFPFDSRERCVSARLTAATGGPLRSFIALVGSASSISVGAEPGDGGLELRSWVTTSSTSPSTLASYDAGTMRYLRLCRASDGGWEAGVSKAFDAGWTSLPIPGAGGISGTAMRLRLGVSPSGAASGVTAASFDDVDLHACAVPRPWPEPQSVPADDFAGPALDSNRWLSTASVAGTTEIVDGRLLLQSRLIDLTLRTDQSYNLNGSRMRVSVSRSGLDSGTLTWSVLADPAPRLQVDWYPAYVSVGCPSTQQLDQYDGPPSDMRWFMWFPSDGGRPGARAERLDGSVLAEAECDTGLDAGNALVTFYSYPALDGGSSDPLWLYDLNVSR